MRKKLFVSIAGLLAATLFGSPASRAQENAALPPSLRQASLDRVVRIYFLTEAYMRDFDRRLDDRAANPDGYGPLATIEDPAYAQLMGAWALAERESEQIKTDYGLSAKLPSQPASGREFSEPLDGSSSRLVSELSARASSVERLALQDLATELSSPGSPQQSSRYQETDLQQGSAALTFASAKEEADFVTAHLSEFEARVAAARRDQELIAEVDALAPRSLDSEYALPENIPGVPVPPPAKPNVLEINGSLFPAGQWALTFDDGPSQAYTPSILDNLKTHSLKASFMWLAQLAPHLAPIVDRAKSEGHTLCNHSFTHANLPRVNAQGLAHEIDDSTEVLMKTFGRDIFAFRCPYGACGVKDSQIRQKIASHKMTSVLWNVDSLDWHDHNTQSVYQRVKKQMSIQRRGIILFHDIHPQSVTASELVMRDLEAGAKAPAGPAKLNTVTLGQALATTNQE